MDLNIKIIDAVKKCPLLYKSNASLPERQGGWRQIAEQMKLQEQFLKSRWHFLREHYQRDWQNEQHSSGGTGSQFIYKKEMEFLLPYLRQPNVNAADEQILPDNVIEPEFIITEKDLENDSGNEEYVFLEVEAIGENAEEVQGAREDEEEPCEHLELEQPAAAAVGESGVNATAEHYEAKEAKGKSAVSKDEKTMQQQFKQQRGEQDAVELKIVDIKDKSAAVCTNKAGAETLESGGGGVADGSGTSTEASERCEDDIFGELVTAMLKRMPTNKKRAVKKDIMNLLLT